MIARKTNVLTSDQCSDIIRAAYSKGFQSAMVRNPDNTSRALPEHRGGEVCFLRKEDLPDLFEIINMKTNELNQNYFNADIDEINLQVAKYVVGQQGFGWHSDDPSYPIEGLIWSGRKLTMVIELTNPNNYEGGLLEIDPTNTRRDKIEVESQTLENSSNEQKQQSISLPTQYMTHVDSTNIVNKNDIVIHVPYKIEGATVEDLMELAKETGNKPLSLAVQPTVHPEPTKVEQPKQQNSTYSSIKEIGSAAIFPSFFLHRVSPVTKGVRYSLTVWCKGPKWR